MAKPKMPASGTVGAKRNAANPTRNAKIINRTGDYPEGKSSTEQHKRDMVVRNGPYDPTFERRRMAVEANRIAARKNAERHVFKPEAKLDTSQVEDLRQRVDRRVTGERVPGKEITGKRNQRKTPRSH